MLGIWKDASGIFFRMLILKMMFNIRYQFKNSWAEICNERCWSKVILLLAELLWLHELSDRIILPYFGYCLIKYVIFSFKYFILYSGQLMWYVSGRIWIVSEDPQISGTSIWNFLRWKRFLDKVQRLVELNLTNTSGIKKKKQYQNTDFTCKQRAESN